MSHALRRDAAIWPVRQICRFTVAGIWFYQGLVPKLLGPHRDELAMAAAFGLPSNLQAAASYAAGGAEILLGLFILALPRHAWPQLVSAVITAALLAFVILYAPVYLVAAFNPVVMNAGSIALSVIAVLLMRSEANDGSP